MLHERLTKIALVAAIWLGAPAPLWIWGAIELVR
jgi:hypothetical protein